MAINSQAMYAELLHKIKSGGGATPEQAAAIAQNTSNIALLTESVGDIEALIPASATTSNRLAVLSDIDSDTGEHVDYTSEYSVSINYLIGVIAGLVDFSKLTKNSLIKIDDYFYCYPVLFRDDETRGKLITWAYYIFDNSGGVSCEYMTIEQTGGSSYTASSRKLSIANDGTVSFVTSTDGLTKIAIYY